MTHRKRLAAASVAALVAFALAAPGSAQTASDDKAEDLKPSYQVAGVTYLDVIEGLEKDGFQIDKVTRTFLGRYRILARNATQLREVVVSSSTGEILRDVILRTLASEKDDDDGAPDETLPSGSADAGVDAAVGADVDIGTDAGGVSTGGAVGVSGGLGIGD